MPKIMCKRNVLIAVASLCVLALIGGGVYLFTLLTRSAKEADTFKELSKTFIIKQPVSDEDNDQVAASASPTDNDCKPPETAILHDIEKLNMQNRDCIGWIKIAGTSIDYPLMHTPNDPEHYLNRDFYGSYSDSRVPFFDARCRLDSGFPYLDARCRFDSGMLYLFGHNRFDGSMFTDLLNYQSRLYYESHPVIELQLMNEVRRYDIIAAVSTTTENAELFCHTEFSDEQALEDYLTVVRENCHFYANTDISHTDKFISLVTCEVSRKNGRMIVIGKKK